MRGTTAVLLARALARHGRRVFRHRPDYLVEYLRCLVSPGMERVPGGWRYEGEVYPDYLFLGGASWAAVRVARRFCRGRGIDVGAGYWPFPGATPVDIARGNGRCAALGDFAPGSLDYVFSSHCLEHIEDWPAALAAWVRLLRPGGRLFLYLPHPDCRIWRPGSPVVGAGHRWVPTLEAILRRLEAEGMTVVGCDPGPDAMMSFYCCAERPRGSAGGGMP